MCNPKQVGTIDFSAAGKNCKVLLGDINNDGRMEMIMVQADSGIDERYIPHQVECITAFDLDGNMLWQNGKPVIEPGKFGSDFPAQVHDIDGDGMDEVMAGYDMLDQDGSVLWSCKDLEDHADCIWIGDVNGDGRVEIAVGGSVTVLYDTEGNELWRYADSIESQHIALGKFRDDLCGLQMAGLDRIVRGDGYKGQWDGKDGMFLVDSAGKGIWKEDRKTKGWLTIVDTYRNWNGEGKDYIAAYRRGGGVNPALYDGFMNPVVVFPVDGYLVHGDLFGRGIEDAIVYTEDTAYIFSGTQTTKTHGGKKITQPKRLSLSTLYPGGEY